MHNLNANTAQTNKQIEALKIQRSEHKEYVDKLSLQYFALQEHLRDLKKQQEEQKNETAYFEK